MEKQISPQLFLILKLTPKGSKGCWDSVGAARSRVLKAAETLAQLLFHDQKLQKHLVLLSPTFEGQVTLKQPLGWLF